MELIEGETLEERVRRKGPCDVPMTIAIARQVANALLAAETRGLVHRDIKPGNLMMIDGADETDFTIKVIDFGVAKALAATPDTRELTHGGFVGTPAFASPEQLSSAPVDVRSDIYSLGATLWYLLTGHLPFGDRAGGSAPPVKQLKAAHVPPAFISLLGSMLAIEPAARPNVRDLASRLEALQGRRRRAVMFAIAAFLIAGAGAAYYLHGSHITASSEKSIAVLPFENLSDDKTNEYFADGIHDEVLVNLSRLGDLKVVSRNSVLPYKGTTRNLREIGKALGVKTVLEGSVRQAGNRTRINVQLIDATNDQQIWAESFEPETANLFSAQSDLALRIATALEAKISPAEKALIETPPTRDEAAYNLYLHARELEYTERSRPDAYENDSKAIESLEQAIARDPHFALAYSYLGRLHLKAVWKREDKSGELLERARACVEKALQIAPDLGEAHLAQGIYFADGLHDYQRALPEFAIARHASPNSAECLGRSGRAERHVGRWKEALQYLLKAVSLDPFDAQIRRDLIKTNCYMRDYAAAERAIEQAIIAVPQQANFFRMQLAEVELRKGDLNAARTALESLPPDFESNGFVSFLHAQLASYARDYPEAERWLNHIAEKFGPERTEWWVVRDRAFFARAERDPIKAQAAFREALRVWETHLQKRPDDPEAATFVAYFEAGLGYKKEAIDRMQKVVDLHPLSADALNGPDWVQSQALVYAWCGERDRALEQLAKLDNLPAGPSLGDLKFSPDWDDLRGDARFEKIVAAFAAPLKFE